MTSAVTTSYYLGGKLVAQREGTTLRYIHQDHLTGTSMITSDNGTSLGTVKYYPYGECRNSQSEIENFPTDRLFTGQRYDDSGLYYYGARYYDPVTGRFISPDTIIPDPMNPQTFNRYSYCLNNPLKYIDPSGHITNIHGYDTRYLSYLANSPEALSLAVSLDPGLADVFTSAEYQAHEAARASDPDWVSVLEESETVYDVVALPIDEASGSQVIEYKSESLTYQKEIQLVYIAAPKRSSGYIDINFTVASGPGFTFGVMINDEGIYPYIGPAMAGPGASITYSDSDPTPGWNWGVQGSLGITGQSGDSFGDFKNPNYSHFYEYGLGVPGFSATMFHVWELLY